MTGTALVWSATGATSQLRGGRGSVMLSETVTFVGAATGGVSGRLSVLACCGHPCQGLCHLLCPRYCATYRKGPIDDMPSRVNRTAIQQLCVRTSVKCTRPYHAFNGCISQQPALLPHRNEEGCARLGDTSLARATTNTRGLGPTG